MTRLDLGYYTVDGKIFPSKVAALIEGTRLDIHPAWHFNNEVFGRIDWSQEPAEDIYELYRQRAQQLRDKYDYLVLMYSGGSDSQTIFDVCIKNKIKIDELVIVWAPSLNSTYTPDPTDTSWDNRQSEWDYTIRPRLDHIAQHHPQIKITVHDWAECASRLQLPDDFIADRNHNFTPYAQARWDLTLIPSLADRLDHMTSVGVIFGTDKPRVCIRDGCYQLYFLDILTSNAPSYSAGFMKKSLGIELFYWSPDSWRILAKQSLMIVDFFERNTQLQQFIQWPMSKPANRHFYETVAMGIIYPSMNLQFFQTQKFGSLTFGMDTLLFKTGQQEKLQSLQRDNLAYLQRIIAPKYFNRVNGDTALTGMVSNWYPVRPVKPAQIA